MPVDIYSTEDFLQSSLDSDVTVEAILQHTPDSSMHSTVRYLRVTWYQTAPLPTPPLQSSAKRNGTSSTNARLKEIEDGTLSGRLKTTLALHERLAEL